MGIKDDTVDHMEHDFKSENFYAKRLDKMADEPIALGLLAVAFELWKQERHLDMIPIEQA